jgi:hypothetical protein
MEDYISPKPSQLEEVLSRFKPGFEQEKKDKLSQFLSLYVNREEGRFVNEVSSKDCPNYTLVVAGALLTKVINPGEISYLDEILCGRTHTKVDNLGPLSGRQGTEYKPLSQCWRANVELEELVKFMEQREEVPSLLNSNANEEEKKKKFE